LGLVNWNKFHPIIRDPIKWTEQTFFWIIGLDVPDVMSGEFVDGLLDLGQASLLPHLQRREIRVGSGSIPITLKFEENFWLG
jgi:hypothetical protein